MLSIGKMSMGQQGYYASLAREDYYLHGGEPPGQWFGRGAEALDLVGRVENEVFRKLFEGYLGERSLVQNAGSPDRCPGWDLTFSAPKSVSVVWSQAEVATALEIRAAHLEAVERALAYVEEQCGWTRRGKEGAEKERAKLFFATFEHGTSRAQDPQLHTHALMLNACLRDDGTTGALDTFELYKHKMAAGALYRAELSCQLESRLGLDSHRTGSTFELDGVPQPLIDEFSKRRKEIEARLHAIGAEGAVASERLALTSRSHKEHQPRESLLKDWQETGQRFGWSLEQVNRLVTEGRIHSEIEMEIAARLASLKAIERITEGRATFTQHEVVRFTAEEAQGIGIGADRSIEAARDTLANAQQIVPLGLIDGELRYTTQEILELEAKMLAGVERSIQQETARVSLQAVEAGILMKPTIKDEQAEAVRHIAANSGRIAVVTGDAGTGKTFMLDTVREVFEAEGFAVRGAALAGKAAQGLEDGAGISSQTIFSLLHDLRSENPTRPLDERTVLVIDEAGMVGTRQLAELVRLTEEASAKLVLVGDGKQLQAIEIGGGFQAIGGLVGEARLSDIIRQVSEEDRRAVRALSQGFANEALQHYAASGNLEIAQDREKAKELLLSAWEREGVSRPNENLILCGKNIDAIALNREAQLRRELAGQLGKENVQVGNESFHQGDRILFTRNHRGLGVKNGDLGTVVMLDEALGTLTVELDSGKTRTLSAASYDDVRLGYAVTTHKAQGMTATNGFILTDEAMQDRELSYVQASRAKLETRIFTTRMEAGNELADLARRMAKSHEKELAHQQAQRAVENVLILARGDS
jgi:Ti-type conjugative transfer relaxase TraA